MVVFFILGVVVLIFATLYFFAPGALIKADDILKRSVLEGKMTKWSFTHPWVAGMILLATSIILFIAWHMTK